MSKRTASTVDEDALTATAERVWEYLTGVVLFDQKGHLLDNMGELEKVQYYQTLRKTNKRDAAQFMKAAGVQIVLVKLQNRFPQNDDEERRSAAWMPITNTLLHKMRTELFRPFNRGSMVYDYVDWLSSFKSQPANEDMEIIIEDPDKRTDYRTLARIPAINITIDKNSGIASSRGVRDSDFSRFARLLFW